MCRFDPNQPPDQEVVVVGHQHENVNLRAEALRQLDHKAQKPVSVRVGAMEHLAAVARARLDCRMSMFDPFASSKGK